MIDLIIILVFAGVLVFVVSAVIDKFMEWWDGS